MLGGNGAFHKVSSNGVTDVQVLPKDVMLLLLISAILPCFAARGQPSKGSLCSMWAPLQIHLGMVAPWLLLCSPTTSPSTVQTTLGASWVVVFSEWLSK